MAKERGRVTSSAIGLLDLSALVLNRTLDSNLSLRHGTHWHDAVSLQDDQINLASLDAFSALAIYHSLQDETVAGEVVKKTTPGGTAVSLFGRDGKLVAEGSIALDRPSQLKGVNVTDSRTVVVITRILTPSYLVNASLLPSKTSEPISSLSSSLPFNMLCDVRHLRTRNASLTSLTEDQDGIPILLSDASEPPLHLRIDSGPELEAMDDRVPVSLEAVDYGILEEGAVDDGAVDELIRDGADETSAQDWSTTIENYLANLGVPQVVRSRVLSDPYHIMAMIKIPATHGLRCAFARALRDAMFVIDMDDRREVERVLSSKGTTFDEMLLKHPDWVLRRVRRTIPASEILLPRVEAVLKTYGPLKDAATQKPLFDKDAQEKALSILEIIRRGWLSDIPGIPLYFPMGPDKNGLMRYRCVRGTNQNEGGFHQKVIRWFGPFQASIELAECLMRDMVSRHNLTVRGLIHPHHNGSRLILIDDLGWNTESYRTSLGWAFRHLAQKPDFSASR